MAGKMKPNAKKEAAKPKPPPKAQPKSQAKPQSKGNAKPPSKPKPKSKASAKASASVSMHGPGPMVSAQEMQYMAEDDARTLMRAEEIKRDAARLRKAKAVAQKKADEALQVAKL